ncbi:MAG: Aldose 1-epimerase [Frankiales bacterium]|nr:Aldose 1-epimerase [Frankiales bacterium]
MTPSGQQHEIASGRYRAVVVEGGGGLREASADGRPLLDPYAASDLADGARGQVLAPWPNRIRDGRWTWQGKELQLPLSEPAKHNASHGLVRWAAWTLLERTVDRVVLAHRLMPQSGYPFHLELTVDYRVSDDAGLQVVLTATNAGDAPAPVALGMHPYVAPPAGDTVDGCVLQAPGATRVLVDDRSLPVGREPVDGTPYDFRSPTTIGDLVVDVAYTDLGGTQTRLSAGGRTHVLESDAPWLQLFTGDTLAPDRRRQGLAVEPLTAPVEAFNTGEADVVEPGASLVLRWSLRAEQDQDQAGPGQDQADPGQD